LKPLTVASFGRGAVFLALLVALPFVFGAHWVVNLLVFTVMYAALASAWNLFSGFCGYVSLGQVAFFGVGALRSASCSSTSRSATATARSGSCR
jgi:branched-chain amino acid transport system permease protein